LSLINENTLEFLLVCLVFAKDFSRSSRARQQQISLVAHENLKLSESKILHIFTSQQSYQADKLPIVTADKLLFP
jgi:hypothetical protein